MMNKAELFDKVKDYLKVNNRPSEDNDVENYIYLAAYEKLMKDMYGSNPIENMKKQNKVDNEQKHIDNTVNIGNGKVTIRMK